MFGILVLDHTQSTLCAFYDNVLILFANRIEFKNEVSSSNLSSTTSVQAYVRKRSKRNFTDSQTNN